jgi:hypothetical protein
MENADAALARGLSDALRDLLDSFSEKFVMVCSYTALRETDWIDFGYSVALERRLDYTIELGQLQKEALVEFIKTHNHVYRKDKSKTKDNLYPFKEDGLYKLYDSMELGFLYPGYFLPNCGVLARVSVETDKEVEANTVVENFPHLRWLKGARS